MVNCNNLVIMCMDYRFQSTTHTWLRHRGVEGKYDVISLAGSSLSMLNDTETRTIVVNQIDLARKKHSVKRIIIFHHEDCAALKDCPKDTREQLKIHHKKMSLARNVILNYFPELIVEEYFISLKGVFYPAGFKDVATV
ncbi:MAG: hypothetical protein VR67_07650 [Peptococcaceae bacterium BRH_c8a]|nr:MAG: hypothetical protein VR67_07650 [Peptococcaceae bacterium BRH_c8a]